MTQEHATATNTGATSPVADTGSLRCQWCSVTLRQGTVICPTCGSTGVPDPALRVSGTETSGSEGTTPSTSVEIEPDSLQHESGDASSPMSRVSYLDVEDRQLQTYGVIVVSVVVFVAIGWLAGPLLAGPMESLTGAPVDNTDDLRPTGSFLGLLTGFLVGATGGWIIWSGR